MISRDYPPMINNVTLSIRCFQWDTTYDKIESVNETEAGTDDVDLLRAKKRTIACMFQCTDRWAKILSGFDDEATLSVKHYDPKEGYITSTMRMENYKESLAAFSENDNQSNGLYTITFDLVEF